MNSLRFPTGLTDYAPKQGSIQSNNQLTQNEASNTTTYDSLKIQIGAQNIKIYGGTATDFKSFKQNVAKALFLNESNDFDLETVDKFPDQHILLEDLGQLSALQTCSLPKLLQLKFIDKYPENSSPAVNEKSSAYLSSHYNPAASPIEKEDTENSFLPVLTRNEIKKKIINTDIARQIFKPEQDTKFNYASFTVNFVDMTCTISKGTTDGMDNLVRHIVTNHYGLEDVPNLALAEIDSDVPLSQAAFIKLLSKAGPKSFTLIEKPDTNYIELSTLISPKNNNSLSPRHPLAVQTSVLDKNKIHHTGFVHQAFGVQVPKLNLQPDEQFKYEKVEFKAGSAKYFSEFAAITRQRVGLSNDYFFVKKGKLIFSGDDFLALSEEINGPQTEKDYFFVKAAFKFAGLTVKKSDGTVINIPGAKIDSFATLIDYFEKYGLVKNNGNDREIIIEGKKISNFEALHEYIERNN